MSVQVVPVGLAEIPPGPRLGAVLAGIDLTQVSNGQIVEVLKACARQRAYTEALMFAVIADVGARDPSVELGDVGYLPSPSRYGADELRPALSWTRRKADYELDFAWALTRTLPHVFTALLSARIDLPKARIFCTYLADLPAEKAEAICVDLLPQAGAWTSSKLADRLRRLVIGSDPKRAEDLYRQALAKGDVVGFIDDNGTATLTAQGMAPRDMAGCFANIDKLARDIRRAGHPAKLGWLRVRLLCGLADTTLHSLTREQIIAHFLDTTRADSAPKPGVEVRVELGTLLGRDEHPGELARWGPVLAGNARETALSQRGAQWSFAVCDDDGFLLVPGISRYRPACATTTRNGGMVEVQLSERMLAMLLANPPKGWEKVIADIAAQHQAWPSTRALLDGRPDRRFPTTGLRRHTQARDRSCRGPGCRQAASRCDFDHTVDYHHGGPTTSTNGASLCRHDHNLKSEGGWTFHQPEPGVLIGTSPLGQVYRSRGDPVITPQLPTPEEPPF